MKPLSQALNDLTKCAEDIVVRPAMLLPNPASAFFDLVGEIQRADHKPAEGVRATSAAMVMIPAIENFYANPRSDHRWQMVIGALLPLLRIDAFQALQNEREQLKQDDGR